jgi:hypothetical protein
MAIRFTTCKKHHIVKHEAICDGSARGRAQDNPRKKEGVVGETMGFPTNRRFPLCETNDF